MSRVSLCCLHRPRRAPCSLHLRCEQGDPLRRLYSCLLPGPAAIIVNTCRSVEGFKLSIPCVSGGKWCTESGVSMRLHPVQPSSCAASLLTALRKRLDGSEKAAADARRDAEQRIVGFRGAGTYMSAVVRLSIHMAFINSLNHFCSASAAK
eukprot:1153363-Pelagomonas_calceolata.AAC.6